MHVLRRLPFLCLIVLLLPLPAQPEEEAAQEIPADDLGRGTPKRSSDGFIAAADVGDYDTAAEYLDLRNLRGAARDLSGAQLAQQLFIIIQRADWVEIEELVDDPRGKRNDNLPDYRDAMGVVMNEGRQVQLFLQRVPRGDDAFIWKVSNASVSLIPSLYANYGYPEYVEKLRRSVPEKDVFGMELFKWIVVLGVGFSVYVAVLLGALIIRLGIGKTAPEAGRRAFRFLALPFGIWLVVIAVNWTATSLGRGIAAEHWEHVTPVPVLITVWLLFATANLVRDTARTRFQRLGRMGASMLLGPATNAVKLVIVAGATLAYLNQLGLDITTVLAGLGVGGIAVALALQKPMEDVFGAVTLYTQQPVRVGDFCRVGDVTGTIEEIGLRTTRIRTLANTVIAIPNSKLAAEPIDNISARQKILFRNKLRLSFGTTRDQLEKVLEGCRTLLETHSRVLADGQRVRFNEIGDDGLLVEVYAYVDTPAWAEYLEIAEDLNLRILEIVAGAGTSLSPPARLQIEHGAAAR